MPTVPTETVINSIVALLLGVFGGVVVALVNNHFNRPAVKAEAGSKIADAADSVANGAKTTIDLIEARLARESAAWKKERAEMMRKLQDQEKKWIEREKQQEKKWTEREKLWDEERTRLNKRLDELAKENGELRGVLKRAGLAMRDGVRL